nr:EamA family transporter RarD [Geomicrobium sediminis]
MSGYVYVLAAYLLWGMLGVYWNLLHPVNEFEVMAHRILWGFVVIIAIACVIPSKRVKLIHFIRGMHTNKGEFVRLCVASIAISTNWFVFIYAMMNGAAIEASLGLYITPLVSILIGVIVFHDRVDRRLVTAIALAFTGVILVTYGLGTFPFIALLLALTSGVYGLAKKKVKLDAVVGMAVETMIATPVAIGILLFFYTQHSLVFGSSIQVSMKLVLAGLLTVLPLLWFSKGVQTVSLTTVGFFQYITPTIVFLMGVFVFQSTVAVVEWIAFGLIWSSLLLYSLTLKKRKSSN